jgi:hypothetical protein
MIALTTVRNLPCSLETLRLRLYTVFLAYSKLRLLQKLLVCFVV